MNTPPKQLKNPRHTLPIFNPSLYRSRSSISSSIVSVIAVGDAEVLLGVIPGRDVNGMLNVTEIGVIQAVLGVVLLRRRHRERG